MVDIGVFIVVLPVCLFHVFFELVQRGRHQQATPPLAARGSILQGMLLRCNIDVAVILVVIIVTNLLVLLIVIILVVAAVDLVGSP